MSKINIFNTIDIDKLRKEVEKFEVKNKKDAYIFMSFQTMVEIVTQLYGEVIKCKPNNCRLFDFEGRKVYEDNDLKLGEVDIR